MRRPFLPAAVALLGVTAVFAQSGASFDKKLAAFRGKAGALLDDGLALVGSCEGLPCPDGVFSEDVVEPLLRLPFERKHAEPIGAILAKKDPHLQEAGLKLAAAAERHARLARVLAPKVAEILERKDFDPWVLLAAVDWFRSFSFYVESIRGPDADFVSVYKALVVVADRGEPAARGFPDGGIMRQRAIDPWKEIDPMLDQVLPGLRADSPLVPVILPRAEKRYGTKGLPATGEAIRRAIDRGK